jgi:uncharacterized tellurite resistance protein B-like protein
MKQIADNWTKEEFKAFLMLHVAKADLKVSTDELFLILDQVDEEAYRKIVMVHSKLSDSECLRLIQAQKEKHFPGGEGKEFLIGELTTLALADSKFSVYEQNLIRSLKKFI